MITRYYLLSKSALGDFSNKADKPFGLMGGGLGGETCHPLPAVMVPEKDQTRT